MNDNHFFFSVMPKLQGISENLEKDSNIKFLAYAKYFNDGSYADLTTVKSWGKNYVAKYLANESLVTKDRLKTGINYWKKLSNEKLSEINEDARDNFNIDARIDFIYRDSFNDCFYYYSFCSNPKHADKAYSFYGMHTVKLIKFISYFNREASHLIAEANKRENRIIIPNYTPPNLPEKTRDFVAEMKAVGATYKLGDRETEALLLYAAGYTAKQIGEMFHRSPKTIENHLDRIKKKTGCKDRKDLHAYVRDIGLAGMERFFFSYFTHI